MMYFIFFSMALWNCCSWWSFHQSQTFLSPTHLLEVSFCWLSCFICACLFCSVMYCVGLHWAYLCCSVLISLCSSSALSCLGSSHQHRWYIPAPPPSLPHLSLWFIGCLSFGPTKRKERHMKTHGGSGGGNFIKLQWKRRGPWEILAPAGSGWKEYLERNGWRNKRCSALASK